MNEQAFRRLISGRRRGPAAACLRASLSMLSIPYGLGVRLRNAAFRYGLLRCHRAAVPVVSVGNVTAGGTGKTPFVAFLANWFRDRGLHPVLLSRGYRALDDAVNDEKLVLDQLCPNVPHLQDADRVRAAGAACQQHAADVLILDDGFQHRRLVRDLNIVLVDALNPWGYGRLLPRGLLREPLIGLRRADVIAITRADQCDEAAKARIHQRLRTIAPDAAVAEVAYPARRLRNSQGEIAELSSLDGQKVGAFCGIGNPEGFRHTLQSLGAHVDWYQTFPDHHHYTQQDLDSLAKEADRRKLATWVTTQKDLVKINRPQLGGCSLWAVEIGCELLAGADDFEQKLRQLAANAC